jgi:hypothetical protein
MKSSLIKISPVHFGAPNGPSPTTKLVSVFSINYVWRMGQAKYFGLFLIGPTFYNLFFISALYFESGPTSRLGPPSKIVKHLQKWGEISIPQIIRSNIMIFQTDRENTWKSSNIC